MTIHQRLDAVADRPTTGMLLLGLSIVGYVLCLQALLAHGILQAGGEGGGDVFAYWTAGGNLRSGQPVYGAGVGGYAAFLYPPPLAQLFVPLSALPFPVTTWVWRGVELVALRIAVGSWRNAGVALLVWPPAIAELDAANVHLIVAAAVASAARGTAAGVVPVALTKFASIAAVPLAVHRDLRGLVLGGAIAGGVCLASFVLGPRLWSEYVTFVLSGIPVMDSGWYNVGASFPVVPRLVLASVVALLAIRWSRLAGVAATLALPVLWFHGLSVLVAVWARPKRANPGSWRRSTSSRRTLVPVTDRTTGP